MRRLAGAAMLVMAAIWVMGCAGGVRKAEVVEGAGKTAGIFTEVASGANEPEKVDLIVRLSIKTHLPDHYLLESKESLHGKPGYPFTVTVDGQTRVWREDGKIETTPMYDADGVRTPEGGEGRRYVLEKRLRMAPGSHRVSIDLPAERCARSVNVTLEEGGEPYLLELKPVYRRSGKQRANFLHGLTRLEAFLDGRPVIDSPPYQQGRWVPYSEFIELPG